MKTQVSFFTAPGSGIQQAILILCINKSEYLKQLDRNYDKCMAENRIY